MKYAHIILLFPFLLPASLWADSVLNDTDRAEVARRMQAGQEQMLDTINKIQDMQEEREARKMPHSQILQAGTLALALHLYHKSKSHKSHQPNKKSY